jgi:hypothetical protein
VLLTAPAAAQDITTGMRGHWRLVETSGTTATDTTSTAQNGTYTGGVSLAGSAAVPYSYAIPANFDGAAHYVTIANHADLQPTGALTIAAWVRGDAWGVGSDVDIILRKGEANPNNYALSIADGRVELVLDTNDDAGVQGSTTLSTGTWYHVAATWDGSNVRIYVNGVLDNTPTARTGTIGTDTRAAYIGGRAGADLFDGGLYDVRLYNRALSASEISTLHTQTGLIGHWKLIQTSGTTATDSSPNLNTGTYTGGVTLASAGPYPGAGDKAASFDGVNDYVSTANDYLYDITGPITIGAWIKVNSFTIASQTILAKGNATWRLQRNGSTNQLQFVCNGLTATTVNSTSNLNDGLWHHVMGTYNGNTLAIYVDGVLEASTAATGVLATNNINVRIAENAETTGRYWNGAIHDARIYSVALSASQVAALYGLVGRWELNQTSGTSATDSTVFAKHGTLSGTANWTTDCGGMRAFDFNGTNTYFSTTNASHLQPTSAITIAAWIKGDAWGVAGDVDTIIRKGEATPNNYGLDIANGRVELMLDDNDSAGVQGNSVLATGQWYHVAGVWDGATVKIYVNGVLDNSPPAQTGTIGTDTRPLYICGRSGADYFDGMIRGVRMYNRALYESEIKKLAGESGIWLFAEGSGVTAADTSGQANNATLSGGATWTTDCGGNAALLTNGTGGIAQTASPFIPPDVGTIAFWMRSTGAPAGTARILGSVGDWEIRQINDGRVISDLCGDGGTNVGTVTPLTEVSRWYHFAATFDSADDTYAIYVDGKLESAGTNSSAMSQQPADILSFGTRTGSTEYWNGALRDVRVYNRKLCPTEIAALYGLIGHWKLDETSGTTAADSSGLGNHGTYAGSPTLGVAAAFDLGAHFPTNGTMLTAPASSSLNSLGTSNANFCVAFWVKPSTAPGDWRPLIHKGAANFDRGPGIWLNPGNTRIHFKVSTSANNNEGTDSVASLTPNAWSHVAFVKAGNKWRCYINAILDTEFTLSGTTTGNSGPLYIGDDPWYAGSNVYMDDIRIYNRALCPSEITALKTGGNPFGGVRIIKWVEIQ